MVCSHPTPAVHDTPEPPTQPCLPYISCFQMVFFRDDNLPSSDQLAHHLMKFFLSTTLPCDGLPFVLAAGSSSPCSISKIRPFCSNKQFNNRFENTNTLFLISYFAL